MKKTGDKIKGVRSKGDWENGGGSVRSKIAGWGGMVKEGRKGKEEGTVERVNVRVVPKKKKKEQAATWEERASGLNHDDKKPETALGHRQGSKKATCLCGGAGQSTSPQEDQKLVV